MSQRLRILWLKTGPLHPLDTGGKIRTFNLLRELCRRHHVTYLSLRPPEATEADLSAAAEYSREQIWIPWNAPAKRTLGYLFDVLRNALLTDLPYAVERFRSAKMKDEMRQLAAKSSHDLIICDFLVPALNIPSFAEEDYFSPPKMMLFQHNVESQIWKRTYETAPGGPKRAYFKNQWERMAKFEREASARFDGIVAVSEADAEQFRQEFGLTNVLGAVPTGVDLDYFQPSTTPRTPKSLAFLGSMDWRPNIDGVLWFANDILPLIRQRHPEVTLAVIGRNPPPAVRELAQKFPGVTVTGTVPDVRPHLAQAEAMVVPLRIGGGTRIKIFEAMATGIPVVSTVIGAEGLPLKHGEHILLADSPGDFAQSTGDLFGQGALRERLAANALELLRRRFGSDAVGRVFEDYCLALCGQTKEQH